MKRYGARLSLCAVVVLFVLGFYLLFPVRGQDLTVEAVLAQRQLSGTVLAQEQTPHRSAVYFWVQQDAHFYVIQAQKSPLFARYRLTDALELTPDMECDLQDFFYRAHMQRRGETLTFVYERDWNISLILMGIWLCVFACRAAAEARREES